MMTGRRLAAAVALWLSLAGAARAGTVEIFTVDVLSGGVELHVTNSLDVGLGAIDLLVQGGTGFIPDPSNLAISLPDTVYVSRPVADFPWDALLVTNLANGIAIAPAGATSPLGTVQAAGLITLLPGELEVPELGTVFGATLYDTDLRPLVATRIEFIGGCGVTICFSSGLRITVPEPERQALATAAVAALAGAALLRLRSGRGSTRRRGRRRASVALVRLDRRGRRGSP